MKRSEFMISALTLLIPKKLFSIFEPIFYPKNEIIPLGSPSACDGGFLVPKEYVEDLMFMIDEMPPYHPNCRCIMISNPAREDDYDVFGIGETDE